MKFILRALLFCLLPTICFSQTLEKRYDLFDEEDFAGYNLRVVGEKNADGEFEITQIVEEYDEDKEHSLYLIDKNFRKKPIFRFSETQVKKGDQLAAKLGFPTANVYPENLNLDPGVYAGTVMHERKLYKAMFYVPSKQEVDFNSKCKGLLEAHFFDYKGESFYDDFITGRVYFFVRPPVPWEGEEAMKKTLEQDFDKCEDLLERLIIVR